MEATANSDSTAPHFTLSARQEELLFAALNSNNKTKPTEAASLQSKNNYTMAPSALIDSPLQQAPGSGTLNGYEDSPFIDYDYDFDADGSFDYGFANDSQGQMIGKLPGGSSDGDGADGHDKRSHPDDDEEDEEGGGKRREGDEKGSKKPGRKPLTSEPTSKRKAQNRAAQRAFRERKEKHLKDLETKVEDLEKASESANHENSMLRSQVEKMSVELREYRKRLSLGGSNNRSSVNGTIPSYLAGKGLQTNGLNNPNDVNFSFEFPKFGRLPGPPQPSLTTLSSSTGSDLSPSARGQIPSPTERGQVSPRNQSLNGYSANSFSGARMTQTPVALDSGDMSSLSGLFSPSILEGVSKNPQFDFFGNNSNSNGTSGSRSSTDSARMSTGHNTSYSSPSASSTNGNQGPSSSCGTSPEPAVIQSPNQAKGVDSGLTTIGEEKFGDGEGELTFCDKLNMACGNPNQPIPRTMSETGVKPGNLQSPAFDINGIDWFAQQNNNQFDPQLFGDYREPQQNILTGDAFADSFFNDALAMPDFDSPFNIAPSPLPPHKDLVAQIDKQNEEEEVVPGEDTSQLLTCNTIWDRLQACPKVKDNGFDLDLLCKDLQKKAKCSETGAVVNESDFNDIMKSYVDNANKASKSPVQ